MKRSSRNTNLRIPDIGGHVSAAGGLFRAIGNGETIGATTIQIFGASPQTWGVKPVSDAEAGNFREAMKESGISSAYLHAAYLVNLASASEEIYRKSIRNLSEHFRIAESIGAKGLIFHLGSNKGISKEEGIRKESKAIRRILKDVPGNSFLVMENSAGGGDKIGSDIEDVRRLFEFADSERVKVCFDTAHAFEAGMIDDYSPKSVSSLFDEWDEAIGIENLIVLHINDSKTAFGSRHDRHENVGEGHIGISGFRALAGDVRLRDKEWILEVPGFDGRGPDKKNIDIVKSLFKSS